MWPLALFPPPFCYAWPPVTAPTISSPPGASFAPPEPLNTAVLFLVFNRPDVTYRVFEMIRRAKPPRLYVAADGPRADRPAEAGRCEEVRAVASRVDWPCEVRTLFRKDNLGCKRAVSSAIDWFFENEEQGIILEDDCVAHPSFFRFAAELLERYRDDERVMMISGDNFRQVPPRTGYSYYFSRYTHIWGWATWRRAWRLYDHTMASWPELRDGDWLLDIFGERGAAEYWKQIFDETHGERNTSWAYRWIFTTWSQSGLTVIPSVNLVSNIGFGEQATHTKQQSSPIAALDLGKMVFPLRHPPYVVRDEQADAMTQKRLFSSPRLTSRIARRIRHLLSLAAGN